MRPLRIEVEGFTAFRRRVEISFEDTELFALVGPTGAGKSSVIDAMVFALYGIVPRYQNDNAVAPVINAQSAEARVRLDFEVGGARYTAVRVVRRTKTGATTKEARLECNGNVLAGDARALDNAIVSLLGLSFEQFTKTVVLPQGEFARFLHETPAARQDLLVRLLDLGLYGTLASSARDRGRLAADRVAMLDGELQRLGDVDASAAGVHRSRAAMLGQLAEELRGTLSEMEGIDRDLAQVKSEGEQLRAHQRSLAAVVMPAEVADHQTQVDAAELVVAEAQVPLDRARALLDAATDALAAMDDDRPMIDAIRNYDQLDDRLVLIDKRRAALAELARERDATERDVAVAAALVTEQEQRLSTAQDRSRAAALRHELRPGVPCPVCEQVVSVLPLQVPDREFIDARAAHQSAVDAHNVATGAHDRASRAQARADDEVASLTDDVATLSELVASAPARDACVEGLARIAATRDAEAAARKALVAAERTARDVAAEARALHDRGRVLRRELTAARDTVARFGPPAPGEQDLRADWSALVAWSALAQNDVSTAISGLRARHEELREVRDDAHRDLRTACHALDVDADQPHLLEHLAQLSARALADADLADERHAAAVARRSEMTALRDEQRVAEELARLLGANAFQQWLLEEAIDDLVAGASVRMRSLSSGQFSFERDGKHIAVRDHRNADDLRSVKTLSGGETFLASLALALALADNVAALSATNAPRLESMFLDEGFGSLDPETLDVVAAAIEELGASGRMVGVVTHVRDLADRLPVRYEVTKLPDTSVVERVDR